MFAKLTKVKFLQEVTTQSDSHEHNYYSIHCTIFAAIALKHN